MLQGLLKRFDLSGTAPRREMVLAVIALALMIAAAMLLAGPVPAAMPWFAMITGLLATLTLATLVRRLHDTGRSGLWALLLVVPFMALVLVVALMVLPSRRPYLQGHPPLRASGTALLIVMVLLSLSRLFWAPCWLPDGANKPTLLVGDYLAVRLLAPDAVQRGDMVAFRHPQTGKSEVRRLIGLPGDHVQLVNGVVRIDDQPLAQSDGGPFTEVMGPQGPGRTLPLCANGPVGLGGICRTPQLIEQMPDGRSHAILNLDANGYADNTQVFTVPAGHYFMLGDNRDDSIDSRFAQTAGGMGFVPAENLVGRVSRVLFSVEGPWLGAVWTWRSGRFFKAVE